MAINWGGFVKGASDYGLERLKEERALKMEQQLQELKDKYKQAEELRAHKREQKKVAGTRQSASDPLMVEDVNIEGEVLRTRARSAADIEAEEQNRRKFDADLENLYDQIRHRKDQIGIERERNAIMRERNSSGIDGLGSGAGSADASPGTVLTDALLGSLQLGKTQTDNAPLMAQYRILADDALQRANVAGRDIPAQNRFDLARRLFLNSVSELETY